MPWWASVYLTIFILMTIGGIHEDLERPNKIRYIGGEIITAIFVVIFMFGFFNKDIGASLGVLIFPMLLFGVVHELLAAKRTMDEEENNHEYTKRELFYLNNIGLLLANLFIVPGYVFGLMIGIRNIVL